MAEKKTKRGRISINGELCKGCYLCVSFCPENLIEASDKLNPKGYYPAHFKEENIRKENRRCTGCMTCATICPDLAIEVYRG